MSLDILNILQIAPPFSGVGGGPIVLPPPTYYLLDGPGVGYVGADSSFIVTLGPGTLAGSVTITPLATDVDGDFSPSTLVLTDATRSDVFVFTPSDLGSGLIGTSDDAGLSDPADMPFTVLEGAPPGGGGSTHVMLRPAWGPPVARAWRPGRGRRSRG